MNKVIILGSSRNDGDASRLVDILSSQSGWDVINLNDYNFSYYDYENLNRNDDYINLMKVITEKYDCLIFVTPVYWYAMSGIMKVFFDRITDLITIEKDLGRKLRNKKMAVITSSNGSNLGELFWPPFKETANYLGMKYLGGLHTNSTEDPVKEINQFVESIEQNC